MGYTAVYKPSQEWMDENIKPWNYGKKSNNNDNYVEDLKLQLSIYCMKKAKNDVFSDYDIIKEIRGKLQMIESYSVDEVRRNLYARWENDEDKELYFCGWEWSKEEPDLSKEDHYKFTLERLVLLKTLVDTPDYFDKSDKFYEKYNEVTENVNDFAESIYTCIEWEFIDKMKEAGYKDLSKEDYEFDKIYQHLENKDEETEESEPEENPGDTDVKDDTGDKTEPAEKNEKELLLDSINRLNQE